MEQVDMEWVNIKDRLPPLKHQDKKLQTEYSDLVLVVVKKSKSILILYYAKIESSFMKDRCNWYFKNDRLLHDKSVVTHWMQLPALPDSKEIE